MTIPTVTPYTGDVANPDGSQTQTEFTQNMFDQLSFEKAFVPELNNSIAEINNTASQVDTDATNAAQAASDAQSAADSVATTQFVRSRIGNISDYAGGTLTESGRFNIYQYPDDSDYWYGVKDGETFPITIPSDPSNDDKWAVVNSASERWVTDNFSLRFDTISDAVNSGSIVSGNELFLKERVAGGGGGGQWSVVLTSSVTPNTFDVVQCTAIPSLSLVFNYKDITFLDQLADNPTNWSPAIQYAMSTGRQINLAAKGYYFSDTLKEEDTINLVGVQTYNLGGPNEFIPSIKNTSRLVWTGPDDITCIDMDMKNCSRNSITDIIIQVPNSYTGKVAILRGGSWQSVGGVNAVYWDNIGWYRETPIDSPTSTAQPLEIDCQGDEIDGRAAFNWFIRGYCFNFSLAFSALVDNNGGGSNNFINSNTFDFRTYQCYREVNLVAGTTSGNIITHNNFKWVSQPAKSGGVSFDGRFYGLNLVSENRFDALEWDVSGGRQFNMPYSNSRRDGLGSVVQLSLGTTYTGLGNFEEVIHKHQDASFSHRVRSKDADTLEITSNTIAGTKDNASKEFISVEYHVEDTASGLQNTYVNENVGTGTTRHSGDGAYSFGKTTSATTVNGLEINTNPLDADSGRANFAMNPATNAAQLFNASTGGLVGSITVNAASVSYNTTSDCRLKNFKSNPTDAEVVGEFDKLFRSFGVFRWKSAPELGDVWGFNAQKCVELGLDMGSKGYGPPDAEIGSVYETELIPPQYSESGEVIASERIKDKIVTPFSVDQSKAIPILVAMIEQLSRRLNDIEGGE